MASRSVWCGVAWSWAVGLAVVCHGAEAGKRVAAVDLFAALEAEQVEVTVIPEDASRLTIQVANKLGRPLTIRVPDAVAAVPVLAQMRPQRGPGAALGQPFGAGLGNNRAGGNQAAQGLGAPFGQLGQNNMFPGGLMPGGMLNVLPGRVVKQKLPCVCLDFGKRDPNPRLPYRLERLENVQDQADVRALLAVLGRGHVSQRIVQLAIWHVANDVNWERLARIPHEQANGTKRPQFSTAEVQRAQALVQQPLDGPPGLEYENARGPRRLCGMSYAAGL